MKPYIILIGLTVFVNSCIGDTSKNSKVESSSQPTEKVKMLFYDPNFEFDTTSKLRLDGYYQIRQIFGSYTTNDKDYYSHDPTYGYIQFFNDGFCKVGWWNGFFQSPTEIKNQITNNTAFGFWGIYKIAKDTLIVEYLFNPASPGVQYSEQRNILFALMDTDNITVTINDNIKYSYPEVMKDSLSSSCIGKFVKMKTEYHGKDNYLKKEIGRYQ